MENILLIGGDARSIAVIHSLYEKGYSVNVLGFEQCDLLDNRITQLPSFTTDFSTHDVIILPVDGVDPNGKVNCPYSDKHFTLTKEIINNTAEHCKVLSGIANDYLKEITAERTLELIFTRNDIAIYNSIPTAEATLQIAMEQTDVTIHNASVAVIGYGRVGFSVAQLFQQVGADVTSFMRSDEDFARSEVAAIRSMHSHQLSEHIAAFSICINTVPELILDKNIINQMSADTLIIDLASKPGGTNFEAAEQRGIKAIHALGLPGKVAPKTAGNILAATILKMM